jgi:hypothetical protein
MVGAPLPARERRRLGEHALIEAKPTAGTEDAADYSERRRLTIGRWNTSLSST